jgi:predicted permease
MPDLDAAYSAAVQLVGRLGPGQSFEEGRAAFATVVARLPPRPGERPPGLGQFASLGGASEEFGGVTAFFAVLLVVTGLVLAIACANVAGLLVARGTVRRRELAVRAALGASRRRLVQQLLADGFWLAAGGTTLGLAMTAVVLRLASRIELPLPVPVVLNPNLRGGLLWYALALLAVTTIVSALVPAFTVSRQPVTSALRSDEPQYGHRRFTLRNLLVVVQVAVALLLLTTAGLFIRNLTLTHTLDPGFDVRPLLVAQVTFPPGRHSGEARLTMLDDALARLEALPGVQRAAFARGVPLTLRSGGTTGADLRIDGDSGAIPAMYEENWVSAGYFEAMGMRLLAGRDLAPTDTAGTPAVVLVSKTFAQRYLGGHDPVGLRLVLPGPPNTAGIPAVIVGVVSDSKHRTIGEAQKAALYSPYAQNMGRGGEMAQFLIRTSTDPVTVLRPARDALAALDPSLAVDVQTMQAALAFAFLPSRVGAVLLGASGALGLLLALVGLYAAVSFAVSRRTAEIGIRRALGASGASVMRLVLGDWAWLVLTGIATGLAGAWLITRPLAQFLVDGLSATDPMSFVVTPVLLAALSAVATVVPAMAALRVDPARVLRNE